MLTVEYFCFLSRCTCNTNDYEGWESAAVSVSSFYQQERNDIMPMPPNKRATSDVEESKDLTYSIQSSKSFKIDEVAMH